MHSPARSASVLLMLAAFFVSAAAQTATPAASPAPTVTPAPAAPAPKTSVSDADAKLEVALRSYSLLDAEADRLKAANARLTTEKAALETKLAEFQAAVPLAAQAAGLRDQLRQVQAQMAAYAEENVQLKTRLGLGGGLTTAASTTLTPTPVAATPTPTPAPTSAPHPEPRKHIVVAGDTLTKISQTYYGTPNRWNEILAANRDTLKDEKSLVIGHTLIVP